MSTTRPPAPHETMWGRLLRALRHFMLCGKAALKQRQFPESRPAFESTPRSGDDGTSPNRSAGTNVDRQEPSHGESAPPTEPSRPYHSRYRHPDGTINPAKVGSYNARQRIVLGQELEAGKAPYPCELILHVSHPHVRAACSSDVRLLPRLQHANLQWFNWFTSHLEHRLVIPVLLDLKEDTYGLHLPDLMRMDGGVIAWEEGGHAHFADELSLDLGRAIGEAKALPMPRPEFYDKVSRIESRVAPELRPLVRFLFVVGTETSITGVLSKLPKYEGVVTAVRDVILDHSKDEARHSSYFTDAFEQVFPNLPSWARRALGPLLPEIIAAFLEPDLRSIRYQLTGLGLMPDQINDVIEETYTPATVRAMVADSAAGTLALFRRNGLFTDPATLDAFHKSGLLGSHDVE